MNKDEIVRLFALEFGLLGDEGEILDLPTIHKSYSYKQLYDKAESMALYLEAKFKIHYIDGQKDGLEQAKEIIKETN